MLEMLMCVLLIFMQGQNFFFLYQQFFSSIHRDTHHTIDDHMFRFRPDPENTSPDQRMIKWWHQGEVFTFSQTKSLGVCFIPHLLISHAVGQNTVNVGGVSYKYSISTFNHLLTSSPYPWPGHWPRDPSVSPPLAWARTKALWWWPGCWACVLRTL